MSGEELFLNKKKIPTHDGLGMQFKYSAYQMWKLPSLLNAMKVKSVKYWLEKHHQNDDHHVSLNWPLNCWLDASSRNSVDRHFRIKIGLQQLVQANSEGKFIISTLFRKLKRKIAGFFKRERWAMCSSLFVRG